MLARVFAISPLHTFVRVRQHISDILVPVQVEDMCPFHLLALDTAYTFRLRFLRNLRIKDSCCLSSQRTVILGRFTVQAPGRRVRIFLTSCRF